MAIQRNRKQKIKTRRRGTGSLYGGPGLPDPRGAGQPRKVTYGQAGLKRGVPKDQQRRNLYNLPNQGGGYDTGWNQTMGGGRPEPGGPPRTDQYPNPNVPAGQGNAQPTAQYLANLKAAGLRLGPGGKIVDRGGSGMATPEQQRLLQRGYNKFGLMNQFYDPRRAAFFQGNMYELGSGTGLNNGGSANVLTDQQLARLQARSGWTPESSYGLKSERAWRGNPGSLEEYVARLAAARQNALNPEQAAPAGHGASASGTPGTVDPQLQAQATALQQQIQQFNAQEAAGFPLDPEAEAARRMAEDQYQAIMAQIAPALANLQAQGQLQYGRMTTDEEIAKQNTLDSLAARGVYTSGITGQELGDVATDALRNRQDYGQQLFDAYGNVYGQANQAALDYSQALQEILLQSAANRAADPYTVTPSLRTGGGRGGGNWTPSWQPKWQPPKQRRRNR